MSLQRIIVTAINDFDPVPFRSIGYEPLRINTLKIKPNKSALEKVREVLLKGDCDSIGFMSPRSIHLISPDDRLLMALSKIRIYAVGPSTKRSLETWGISITGMPNIYTGAALAELLLQEHLITPFTSFYLLRSSMADSILIDRLNGYGIPASELMIYSTIIDPERVDHLLVELERGVDAIVFTSKSSAVLMAEKLREDGRLHHLINLLASIRVIAYGPETAKGVLSLGIEPEVLRVHSMEGLVSYLKGDGI